MKRKNIIQLSLIAGMVLLFANAKSQQLKLTDAVALGVKNSRQLHASKARIDIATAALIQAKNNQLPNFNVSASYLRLLQPNINLKQSGSSSGAATPKITQAMYGIANLSFPIYAGGKIRYGIESAKYLQQAAGADAQNDTETVRVNVVNSFIAYYKALKTVGVVKEHLQASRMRDTTFSRLEENGLLARNDLLKARLFTSNLELGLLDAENDVRLTAFDLDILLGLPTSTDPAIDTTLLQDFPLLTYEQYQGAALSGRNDIKALALRSKAAAIAIKSARADELPTIALTGGYVAADIPKFVTITNAVNAGIGIQYNLAALWKSNSRLQEARARRAELEAQQGIQQDAVSTAVNTAYERFLLSQKRIDVYRVAIEQAQENYRISKNKYENNLLTLTDLLDADVAQQQAQLNYAVAKADATAAYYSLLYSAGILKL